MSFRKVSLFLVIACISAAGCGKGLLTRPLVLQDPVTVPLKFSVSTTFFLSDKKVGLWESIRDGKQIAYGDITHALIEDHLKLWQEKHKEDEQTLDQKVRAFQALAANLPTEELSEAKAELEKRLSAKQPLIYNGQSITIFDTLQLNRLQCYSGTATFSLALRESWGRSKSQEKNLVVIYESGHVLPGYMVQEDGVWNLYGVETTVEGRGKVVYGPINEARKDRLLRIVDAELFAVVELFKFAADDILDMANQALKITAEKYGIEDPAYLVRERFRREADYGKIAWSPFTFGNPDISRNDRTRVAMDERPRSELPRANPNLTIFHSNTAPPEPATVKTSSDSWADPEPPYPYRQVGTPEHPVFECWNYAKGKWMKIITLKVGEEYVVHEHPCKTSRANYEPLPSPLVFKARTYYDDHDAWDDWYD